MAPRAEDRRVQRTRGLLQESLAGLVLEKGYGAVTVQDILDRANVGRSTFYAHFPDKEQLLLSTIDQLRAFLLRQQEEHGPARRPMAFSLAMFQHAQSHFPLYQALVSKEGGAVVMGHMQRMLARLVREETAPPAPAQGAGPGPKAAGAAGLKGAIPPDLLAQYAVSSFMALLTWWLDQKLPCSAEEIDRIFRILTLPGLAAAHPPG